MIHWLRRHGFMLTVIGLLGLIGAVGAFIVAVALPDLQGTAALPATPTPSPTGVPRIDGMDWLVLPGDADCAACHSTDQGIGTLAIPALAHPLKGWTDCTACHANDRLVATAPGHTGIHAQDCLLCHKPGEQPAPLSRPHRDLQNQDCLTCHGSTAPLPADMSHRAESVCWLCHRLPQVEPPLPRHKVTVGQKDCLSCHVAGEVGELPEDHQSRDAGECLLCHAPRVPAPVPGSQSRLPVQGSEQPRVPILATGWWPTVSSP